MSQVELCPCDQCMRHVRVSESVCPFCEARLSHMQRAKSVRIAKGASRAAMFTLRTALIAGAAAGCAETQMGSDASGTTGGTESGGTVETGGTETGGILATGGTETGGIAATGGTESGGTESGGTESGGTMMRDSGTTMADASVTGGTTLVDGGAEVDAGFVGVPLYGGVFPDPKSRAKV